MSLNFQLTHLPCTLQILDFIAWRVAHNTTAPKTAVKCHQDDNCLASLLFDCSMLHNTAHSEEKETRQCDLETKLY